LPSRHGCDRLTGELAAARKPLLLLVVEAIRRR